MKRKRAEDILGVVIVGLTIATILMLFAFMWRAL